MTVPSTYTPSEQVANGATDTFPFGFLVLAASHVRVELDGVALSYPADFSVTGVGNPAGGSAVLTVMPDAGVVVTVSRAMPYSRDTDYQNNGDLLADTLNADQDAPILMIQQVAEGLGRALQVPLGSGISSSLPTPEAGKALVWNADEDGLENLDPSELTTVASGNIVWATSTSLPAGAGLNQPSSNQYFAQNGAGIHRLNDRVFIGGATAADGAFPQVANDWVSDFYETNGGYVDYVAPGMLFVATNESSASGLGIVGAAHTENFTAPGTSAIGMYALAVNDNASLSTLAWGLYVEGQHTSSVAGATYAAEFNVRTLLSGTAPTPYQQGAFIGLQLGAGCGVSASGQFDCSAAVQIVSNPMKWFVGINFMSDALYDIGGGYGIAMALAKGHVLRWHNTAGVITGQLLCDSETFADSITLALKEGSFQVQNSPGSAQFEVEVTANAINRLMVTGSTTGVPVALSAVGSDTNIDLALTPKGTGAVWLGAWTSNADAAVNGYITVKDSSGNVRKLATIA